MFKLDQPHVPPHHPNWTGRSHRTSHEAFGSQLWVGEAPRQRRPGAIVITLVALLLLLGVTI